MEETKQQRWRRRKREAGCCENCGQPREVYDRECDSCHDARMRRQRRGVGYRRWQPGGPGRPPKKRIDSDAVARYNTG